MNNKETTKLQRKSEALENTLLSQSYPSDLEDCNHNLSPGSETFNFQTLIIVRAIPFALIIHMSQLWKTMWKMKSFWRICVQFGEHLVLHIRVSLGLNMENKNKMRKFNKCYECRNVKIDHFKSHLFSLQFGITNRGRILLWQSTRSEWCNCIFLIFFVIRYLLVNTIPKLISWLELQKELKIGQTGKKKTWLMWKTSIFFLIR